MLAHTFIVLRSLQYLSIIPQLGSSWEHPKASESFHLAVGMGQALICLCTICSHSSSPQCGSGLLQPSQQTAEGRQERTELSCYSCPLLRMPGCCDPVSDISFFQWRKVQRRSQILEVQAVRWNAFLPCFSEACATKTWQGCYQSLLLFHPETWIQVTQ